MTTVHRNKYCMLLSHALYHWKRQPRWSVGYLVFVSLLLNFADEEEKENEEEKRRKREEKKVRRRK